MNDLGLVNALRKTSGLLAKSDIRSAAATFHHHPFPQLGLAGMLGDDSAVLPAQTGQLLLACEGMHPELVEEDPWFAGWSGVYQGVAAMLKGGDLRSQQMSAGCAKCGACSALSLFEQVS